METNQRDNLPKICQKLIQETVILVRDHFGSAELPIRDVEISVMELGEPAHWLGERFIESQMDTWFLFEFERAKFYSSTIWRNAKEIVF